MKRREFFRKASLGVAAIVTAPQILASKSDVEIKELVESQASTGKVLVYNEPTGSFVEEDVLFTQVVDVRDLDDDEKSSFGVDVKEFETPYGVIRYVDSVI